MYRNAFVVASLVGACASSQVAERSIQIGSVDFAAGVIEVRSFAAVATPMAGWRFCTHDFNEQRRYSGSTGLNGVTLPAGGSLFIHMNNDAPAGEPLRVNRTTLGGAFSLPLDQDAYGMQLFFPINGSVSFGNSAQIADHIQWNIAGSTVGTAEARTGQAVGEQLWSAAGDFIVTTASSRRIELTDLSGDIFGAPSEYMVIEPAADLSDDAESPTVLALELGSNVVQNEVGRSEEPDGDRDFFTFEVPEGRVLEAMTLVSVAPDDAAFLGVNAGPTGVVPSFLTIDSFLAGILFDQVLTGTDLLEELSTGSITTGALAEPLLGPGVYTVVVQQTSDLVQSYELDLVLAESTTGCSPADITGDGLLDVFDILGFFGLFGAGDLAADFSGDDALNVFDILGFFQVFGSGC